MTTDDVLKDLTTRFAVIEQLLIVLTATSADAFDQPQEAAQEWCEDVRSAFAAHDNPEPAAAAFLARAIRHVDQVEQRILALVNLRRAH